MHQEGDRSYQTAKADLDKLLADGTLRDFERHWIVNGFSCSVKSDALDSLKSVRGVKKIFAARRGASLPTLPSEKPYVFKPIEREKFDPGTAHSA